MGVIDGFTLGSQVGLLGVGINDGFEVGWRLKVGESVGNEDGIKEGTVGPEDGFIVGTIDGEKDGLFVGFKVIGAEVGEIEGRTVGYLDG